MICFNFSMDARKFKVPQWIKYMVWREGPSWKHAFIRIWLHYLHIKKIQEDADEIETCETVMTNIYMINILPARMR